jgi:hypothetical protein
MLERLQRYMNQQEEEIIQLRTRLSEIAEGGAIHPDDLSGSKKSSLIIDPTLPNQSMSAKIKRKKTEEESQKKKDDGVQERAVAGGKGLDGSVGSELAALQEDAEQAAWLELVDEVEEEKKQMQESFQDQIRILTKKHEEENNELRKQMEVMQKDWEDKYEALSARYILYAVPLHT